MMFPGAWRCELHHLWTNGDCPDCDDDLIAADGVRVCRTCGHGMTDQERDDYADQCGPCAAEATRDSAPR